jgi:hypothetical protein
MRESVTFGKARSVESHDDDVHESHENKQSGKTGSNCHLPSTERKTISFHVPLLIPSSYIDMFCCPSDLSI